MNLHNIIARITLALFVLLCTISCGGGTAADGSLGSIVACNALTNDGCDAELSCEHTTSGETGCFSPITMSGNVLDLSTNAGIAGARVVAMDANGSAASDVAVTDAEGAYSLTLSVTRNADGTPQNGSTVTLRCDGAGYQTFPGGVRRALPIDVTQAQTTTLSTGKADVLNLTTTLSDIALIPLPSGAPSASISGTVETSDDYRGALVVAERSSTEGYTAIADLEGHYQIFNLPADTYSVQAYAQGLSFDAASATVADGASAEATIALNDADAATLSGSVQIVNAPGGSATSVIMVVESTFDDILKRGETPPGLRAPASGATPNITGAFTIEGVPAGSYVILAGFEDDELVRDPDTCIAGTAILHRTISAGETVDLSDGFKVTEALEILSPGAGGPEALSTTTPTFSWADDSSEDQYDITLLDTFGNEVWTKSIAGVSGSDPSVPYDGPALQSGMYYQFSVISSKNGCELSSTEDLKGVFSVE